MALTIVSPEDRAVAAGAQWSTSVPVGKGASYRVGAVVKPNRQAVDSMSTPVCTREARTIGAARSGRR